MMRDYKGILPGMFTMGSVVCGFLSILSAFEGNITGACWFVILAGFLDGLDGKIARMSSTTSQFGVELDSLADFLSFGVAPAVIVYTTKLSSLGGKWGWVISVVYIMAAAYRLARYNLMADTEEKKAFKGLPVPVAAFALVAYVIFSHHLWGEMRYDELVISMVIGLAFLMVSQVEYEFIPDHFSNRNERIKLVVGSVAVVALLIQPRLLLFPLVGLYILYGLALEGYKLFYLGVGKVSGHHGRRAGTNRRRHDDEQ